MMRRKAGTTERADRAESEMDMRVTSRRP